MYVHSNAPLLAAHFCLASLGCRARIRRIVSIEGHMKRASKGGVLFNLCSTCAR